MKHVFTLVFLLSVLFTACQKSINWNGIIREPVFINVLTDLHLADGIISVKGYRAVADSSEVNQIYNSVFEKYNVTQKEFKTTMDYYAINTAKYDVIYDAVLTRLSELESQIDLSKIETDQ